MEFEFMIKILLFIPLTVMIMNALTSFSGEPGQVLTSKEVLVTSEAGDKIAVKENISFTIGNAPEGNIIKVDPKIIKQEIDGIGTSFTESSAFVLAHLDVKNRLEVMEKIFGESGANFTLTRTHIGSCDFSVEGKYSYLDKKGDTSLESFSILPDLTGFDPQKYPGIKDFSYDLLPMIREALEIKQKQEDKELRIVASAWTAPYWMKDIEDWFIKGTPENNFHGTGGKLKPEYEELFADYIIRYLKEYKNAGVNIWAITPVNEPHGNNGQWESMHFTPESQNLFIKNFLGPKLATGLFSDTKLLIYDQNRDGLEHWTDIILGDEETAKYVYGTAVHWYESTFKVYEDVFQRVNAKFPNHTIIHTEGCIDDLGKDAPQGITDPERFKEKNWFNNDSFWWNANATDWGYSAVWEGVKVEDHPIYTPVHRYARNIIVSLDNWMTGWIDWNIVLDQRGGPNHVGNYCGAPIMIDLKSKFVYYTPIYYILAQLSRTIRPGDRAVQTNKFLKNLDNDALHSCATLSKDNVLTVQLLNTTKEPLKMSLQIEEQFAEITMTPNSIQTVRIQL